LANADASALNAGALSEPRSAICSGCPSRIKIAVRLIHRPNFPQKSAKNAERSAEFWNSLRDSTAEYTECTKKTDSIQSLQFRVFSVFRGSISRSD
jgi:hypothetical protein